MGYNILIADDMLVNRKLIKKVLGQKIKDVHFYDVEDGIKALECIYENPIDLVILDLIMPGKDGFQVLNELKSREGYKEIPVIVNSAMDEVDTVRKALELGATDYFTKPLTIEQMEIVLPVKVENALKAYEQKRLLLRMNQRMKEELKFASILQNILIQDTKELPGVSMVGEYIPSAEVGGDFYGCVQLGEDIWFLIADVSGHGVAAAMISSMIKVMFNNLIYQHSNPAEVFRAMNSTFYSLTHGSYYITAFLGLIRGGELIYSNGGHPYPVLLKASDKKAMMLEQNGFLIGIMEDHQYDMHRIPFAAGDALLMYTDGLLELEGAEGRYRIYEDLFEYVAHQYEAVGTNPKGLVKSVAYDFGKDEERRSKDDVAVMMIIRK